MVILNPRSWWVPTMHLCTHTQRRCPLRTHTHTVAHHAGPCSGSGGVGAHASSSSWRCWWQPWCWRSPAWLSRVALCAGYGSPTPSRPWLALRRRLGGRRRWRQTSSQGLPGKAGGCRCTQTASGGPSELASPTHRCPESRTGRASSARSTSWTVTRLARGSWPQTRSWYKPGGGGTCSMSSSAPTPRAASGTQRRASAMKPAPGSTVARCLALWGATCRTRMWCTASRQAATTCYHKSPTISSFCTSRVTARSQSRGRQCIRWTTPPRSTTTATSWSGKGIGAYPRFPRCRMFVRRQ